MASARDPLAAFDDGIIEKTASEVAVDEARLREIARSHQQGVRDLPGVDDIVYEWRNQFHQDPLVYRTDAVYVLALQNHVWEEFGDSLELTETDLDALQALHDRQARDIIDGTGRLDTDDALVLTRP